MVLSVDVKSSPISAVGDDNKMQDNLRQKWGDVCGAAQQSVGATAKTAAKNTSNKEKCGMPVLLCRDKIYSSFFFLSKFSFRVPLPSYTPGWFFPARNVERIYEVESHKKVGRYRARGRIIGKE